MTERAPGSLCETCVGACCSNVRLALYPDEAYTLQEAGTELIPWLEPPGYLSSWAERTDDIDEIAAKMPSCAADWADVADHAGYMRNGQGLFQIMGECGFLQSDGSCGNYDERPDACREFPAGNDACLELRQGLGVTAVPVVISQKPTKIAA